VHILHIAFLVQLTLFEVISDMTGNNRDIALKEVEQLRLLSHTVS
jgi:hypothetical protein